jgi:hypothetical protein
MLGKRILRRMESRGWDELEYTVGLNWRRAVVPPATSEEERSVSESRYRRWFLGDQVEMERAHSPSRGVVKFVHGVTVGEVSF